MNKTSKIYIAGHRGLVGSALLRGLREAGYANLVVRTSRELDLKRQADVEDFFRNERPEYVFLAAAKVGGILANSTYTAEFIYDNIMIAANVINAAYRTGTAKLLNLGSSCIFPKFAPQPMKEEYLLSGALEPTNEPYAIAKISAIKLCRYYNEQYGTNFISAMPTNLYGPNDNFDLERSHVLPALLRKFHLAKLLREGRMEEVEMDVQRYPIGIETPDRSVLLSALTRLGITPQAVRLWGSGEPYREFLYADDLAQGCIFLMERHDCKAIGEFINIGAGSDIRIKDLAVLVRNIVGFDGDIEHDRTKPDGMLKKLLDSSRINALGWRPRVGLEQGISEVYRQYQRQG